tara:strand:+ start:201 stop:1358 length:1158 start_codon:yes stop_codon:yes gene_type:complete
MEITCPKCSISIDVTEQMSKQLNQELETEKKLLVDKVRKDLEESYSKKFKEIEQNLLEKETLLRSKKEDDELKQLELQEAKHKLENQEKLIEIERKKAALEARKEEAAKFEQLAEEKARQTTTADKIKIKELEDRMRQQIENHEIALRNATQGSVQTQGEGGELLVEDVLQSAFRNDEVREIKKGELGADCIQTVLNSSNIVAGVIVWESKRAKTWSSKWVTKVKTDRQREKGDFSVIVSDILPKGKSSMELIDDLVWVCKFEHVKAMATLLRMALIRTTDKLIHSEGKEEKAVELYNYMIGDQFTQALGLVRDSYIQDVDDIATEERSMKTRWNSRKKQAEIRLDAMANIFGNLKVIADKIPAMKELNEIEAKLLTGPDEDLEL